MTIRRLIEELQKYPLDTPVIGATIANGVSSICCIQGAYPIYEDGKLVKLDNIFIHFPQKDGQWLGKIK